MLICSLDKNPPYCNLTKQQKRPLNILISCYFCADVNLTAIRPTARNASGIALAHPECRWVSQCVSMTASAMQVIFFSKIQNSEIYKENVKT